MFTLKFLIATSNIFTSWMEDFFLQLYIYIYILSSKKSLIKKFQYSVVEYKFPHLSSIDLFHLLIIQLTQVS